MVARDTSHQCQHCFAHIDRWRPDCLPKPTALVMDLSILAKFCRVSVDDSFAKCTYVLHSQLHRSAFLAPYQTQASSSV